MASNGVVDMEIVSLAITPIPRNRMMGVSRRLEGRRSIRT